MPVQGLGWAGLGPASGQALTPGAFLQNAGYHWAGVQADPDVRCRHVPWY